MIGNKNSNGIAVFGNPLLFIADKLLFSGVFFVVATAPTPLSRPYAG